MRRIRYVPGLLSLALMLPLGLWFLQDKRAFVEQRCITLIFPSHSDTKAFIQPIQWTPDRSDTTADFECNGPLVEDLPSLLAFRKRIEDLAHENDRLTAVHLQFGRKATYASVMRAIESCRLTTRSYGLFGNDLWAFYVPLVTDAEREARSIELSYCYLCDDVIPIQRPTKPVKWMRKEIIGPLVAAVQPVWPSVPLFLVLVIFGMRGAFRDCGSSPE